MKITFCFFVFLLSFSAFSEANVKHNRISLNNAFEQLLKSDGHKAEELDIEIGKTIKKDPLLFLKTLKKYEKKVLALGALVGNFGYEFVDKFEESKIEAQSRIKAFESVKKKTNDPDLIRLADRCIKLLKDR